MREIVGCILFGGTIILSFLLIIAAIYCMYIMLFETNGFECDEESRK